MEFYAIIFLICLMGILAGIWAGLSLKQRMLCKKGRRKREAEPTVTETVPEQPADIPEEPNVEIIPEEGENESAVSIRGRIPDKTDSWTGLTCAAEEADEETYILERRKREENGYTILKNKL